MPRYRLYILLLCCGLAASLQARAQRRQFDFGQRRVAAPAPDTAPGKRQPFQVKSGQSLRPASDTAPGRRQTFQVKSGQNFRSASDTVPGSRQTFQFRSGQGTRPAPAPDTTPGRTYYFDVRSSKFPARNPVKLSRFRRFMSSITGDRRRMKPEYFTTEVEEIDPNTKPGPNEKRLLNYSILKEALIIGEEFTLRRPFVVTSVLIRRLFGKRQPAQTSRPATVSNNVEISFERGELLLEYEKTVLENNIMHLRNLTRDTLTLRLIDVTAGTQVFNMPEVISLAPQQEKTQFVKFYFKKEILQSLKSDISLRFQTSRLDTAEGHFNVVMKTVRNVLMSARDNYPFIEKNRISETILINNRGNSNERFILTISPQGPWTYVAQPSPFRLQPYTDSAFNFEAEFHYTPDFKGVPQPLTIELRDSADAVVASTQLYPRLITNFVNLESYNVRSLENYVSVLQGGLTTQNPYQEYQLNYNYRQAYNGPIASITAVNQDIGTIFRNSYVGYKQNDVAVIAGNINQYGELPIFGQGIAVRKGDYSRYISGSYLFNGNPSFLRRPGELDNETKNASVTFATPISERSSVNGILLRQWDSFYQNLYAAGGGIRSQLFRSRDILELGGYYNFTESVLGRKNAGAAYFRYTARKKYWQINLNNYYSSTYYTGLLRNTKQFQNNVTYQFPRARGLGVGAIMNFYDGAPLQFDQAGNTYVNQQINQTLGTAVYLNGRLGVLSFLPTYNFQKFVTPSGQEAVLEGNYLRLDYQGSTKKGLFITAGLETALRQHGSNNYDNQFGAVKFLGNARYQFLTLQLLYQKGLVNATDILLKQSDKPFTLININPAVNALFFKSKLSVVAGYNYQIISSSIARGHYITATAIANLTKHWQLNAIGLYNINGESISRDFRIGARYYFGNAQELLARRKQLIFFNDENRNGKKDNDESGIGGVVLSVSDRYLQTNEAGKTFLLHYHPTTDKLTLLNGRGYAQIGDFSDQELIKRKVYIPMYKMSLISGNVNLIIPKYSNTNVPISGLPLIFTNEKGQSYTFSVQPDKTFSAAMPEGTYSIKIDPELTDLFELQKPDTVVVTPDAILKLTLNIRYKKAKAVETKKF